MIIIQNNGENNGEVFNEKYIYYICCIVIL